ncbi:MAG: Rnase Y domain-containing protein, partial [Chloroflexota bacterium]|nr:Rnase Y domain-containing protein [Chloroflexota bacterium]
MDALTLVIAAIGGIVIGVGGGILVQSRLANRGLQAARKEAERITKDADDQAKRLVNDARHEAREARRESDTTLRERRKEAQQFESRLANREQALDKRQEGMERREQSLGDREQETEERLSQADELLAKRLRQVEEAAGLTTADARAQIMEQAEGEMKHDLARRYYELEQRMLSEADEKARKAIALSIQRLASEVVSETTTAQVALPNDEMKGRLIGREGRNIRTIESATGVDLIVDDTPEAVTISCFDPIRREVARLALTNLIADGRIHPARIEESVDKAKNEVETTIKRSGEQAVLDAGVRGLHPELVHLVGRLKFR